MSGAIKCWAEFYVRKTGWVPVDISQAWKAQEKREYFFGSIDANRVRFSTGRDIALSPKQDGPALNYFIYPYVEIAGKPYEKLDKQFSFAEVKPSEWSDARAVTGAQRCTRYAAGDASRF